jgi:hypothetical protein
MREIKIISLKPFYHLFLSGVIVRLGSKRLKQLMSWAKQDDSYDGFISAKTKLEKRRREGFSSSTQDEEGTPSLARDLVRSGKI